MLLLVFMLGSLQARSSEMKLVSQVVGQAGEQVVTSREVQINSFIEGALFSDEKSKSTLKVNLGDKQFEKDVTHVLIEWVVFKEAEIFNASLVPDDDVNKSIAIVRSAAQKTEYRDYWDSLEVTSNELQDIIKRKLRAKKFIQFKTRASIVPITDAEAQQYFQKNRIRFGNTPFNQFKDSIKSFLAQEQANNRIRDWFELLQKKYRVRRVVLNDKNSTK